jgi:hypothetical protein
LCQKQSRPSVLKVVEAAGFGMANLMANNLERKHCMNTTKLLLTVVPLKLCALPGTGWVGFPGRYQVAKFIAPELPDAPLLNLRGLASLFLTNPVEIKIKKHQTK